MVRAGLKVPTASGLLQTSEELCESRGGRPGLPRPVPTASGPLQISQELCESRGGRPGLPRQCQLPLVLYRSLRSCVKVEVAVLGFPVPLLHSVL